MKQKNETTRSDSWAAAPCTRPRGASSNAAHARGSDLYFFFKMDQPQIRITCMAPRYTPLVPEKATPDCARTNASTVVRRKNINIDNVL